MMPIRVLVRAAMIQTTEATPIIRTGSGSVFHWCGFLRRKVPFNSDDCPRSDGRNKTQKEKYNEDFGLECIRENPLQHNANRAERFHCKAKEHISERQIDERVGSPLESGRL